MTSQLGNPLSQSDEQLAFLAAYGWAMWAVQVFEYRLAGLSIMRTAAKTPARVLDTPQKVYSALEKQFAQSEHRFERASAKELRNLLPTDLPEPLNSELDELVDKRMISRIAICVERCTEAPPWTYDKSSRASRPWVNGLPMLATSCSSAWKKLRRNVLQTSRIRSSRRCSNWGARPRKECR